MDIRKPCAIHSRAIRVLTDAPGNPRSVALCYTLICSLLALIMTVLTGFLTDRIADTGGLSNMGLRSILSTGQSVLPIVQFVVTTCLGLGYHFAVLRIARSQEATPRTLLEGFRYFGPALRAAFFQGLLYFAYGFVSMYLGITIFLATPLADPFYEVMDPVIHSASALSEAIVLDESMVQAVSGAIVPVLWFWGGIFLILSLPVYYSYRLTNFCIADHPRRGALACMHQSKVLMRRNRLALLKLDLSMWWFYLLQALASLVCYGDILLPMVGIELPWGPTFGYYFFFALSLLLQIVTFYFFMNRVNVPYALVYEALLQPEEPDTQPEADLPFPTEY